MTFWGHEEDRDSWVETMKEGKPTRHVSCFLFLAMRSGVLLQMSWNVTIFFAICDCLNCKPIPSSNKDSFVEDFFRPRCRSSFCSLALVASLTSFWTPSEIMLWCSSSITIAFASTSDNWHRIARNIGGEFILTNWQFSHKLPNYDPPILLCHMYSDVIHCDATKFKPPIFKSVQNHQMFFPPIFPAIW